MTALQELVRGHEVPASDDLRHGRLPIAQGRRRFIRKRVRGRRVQAPLIRAMHFSSIAIGVGSAVMPSVVRHGALAGSGKYSVHTAL